MRASTLRRWSSSAAVAGAVFLLVSCGNDSGSPSPTPSDIVVTPGADTLISIGAHRTFTGQVVDANGDPIDGKTITWSSSAPGVLAIDPVTGIATALANGKAAVQANSGTLQGSANVIVLQLVASVTVTPANAAFTAVGDTQRFTAVAKDSGGTPVPGVQVLWTTSDNSVATIDTLGLAKAKGAGNALVSAQAQTHAGYAAVGVDPTVAQFVVLSHPDSGTAGEAISTALQVELRDARGNRVMGSSLAVSVAPAGAATGTPLHGTTTQLADQGRATFSGLWFEKAGADRFKVTVAALPVDSSSLVTVAAAAPARVVFDPVGAQFVAGKPLGVSARVADRFGNSTPGYAGPVRIRVVPGPGTGALFGDTLVAAVAGVASFTTLNIRTAAFIYQLTVAIPDLPASVDTSTQFTVDPTTAASFSVTHFAPIRFPFAVAGDSEVVAVSDTFGNPVADGSIQVTVRPLGWAFTTPPGRELKLLGDTTVGTFQGRAVFQVAASRPGRISLEFNVPGLGVDTTEGFAILWPNQDGGGMIAMAQASCVTPWVCTGDNTYGQLGVPTAAVTLDSVPIPRDSLFSGSVFQVDGGGRHACAVVYNVGGGGVQLECWGDNSDGQLGGGTVGGTSSVQVSGLTAPSFDALAAGGSHTCAVISGVTQCWGKNDAGQLGNGSAGASTGTPQVVTGGHQFIALAAGGRHTCGLEPTGAVWCWGANDFGQLGNGDTTGTASADPVQVVSGLIFSEIVAGDDFTCATSYLLGSNAVYCWGRNDARQLGLATDSAWSALPLLVVNADTLPLIPGTLAAGGRFACVGLNVGNPNSTIDCWGANEHGQLGRGTFTPFDSIPAPASLSFLAQAPGALIAGAEFVCGATSEFPSRWICWGRNDHGQFGMGSTGDRSTPIIPEGSY